MNFMRPFILILALLPFSSYSQVDSSSADHRALREQLQILELQWAQWEKDCEAYLARPENDSLRLKLRREAAQYRAEMRALAQDWKARAESDSAITPYQLLRGLDQVGEGLRQVGLGLESMSRHLARVLHEEAARNDSTKN